MNLKLNQEDTSTVSQDGDWKLEQEAKTKETKKKKVTMTYRSKENKKKRERVLIHGHFFSLIKNRKIKNPPFGRFRN